MSRTASRLALFAAQIQVIEYIRPTTASTSGRILVREATERRWTELSLACWRLKVRTERQVRPLSATVLPPEVVILGDRMTCTGVIGCSIIILKVPLVLGRRRNSVGDEEGDKGGTMARSALNADIFAVEAGTDNGGSILSSNIIV